jgi:hypothetical protein
MSAKTEATSDDLKAALDDLKHAGEFTDIENSAVVYVLRGWFAGLAGIPGALEAGDDAWAFTTLFEHFTSELPSDITKRTKEHLEIQKELKDKAQASQDAVDALLGAKNNEDERMIAETDAFVQSLVEKFQSRTKLA